MNSPRNHYKKFFNGEGSNPSRKVEVKHSAEGWFFISGDLQAGPYADFDQVDYVEVAAQLSGLQDVEEWRAHPDEDSAEWTVQPKDVFKAMLLEYALQEGPQTRRRGPNFPVFAPSLIARCFKRRFRDVGDCDDAGCRYWFWCVLQLQAISEGAVLLFYQKDPTKCSICHRRRAIHLFIVERGAHTPNSLFVTCSVCTVKMPQHWTVLKREDLEP